MKKTLLFLGLFILALTTIISCKDSESESNNNASSNETNATTIGDHKYKINSAMIFADEFENEIELSFYCDDLLFTIDLEGYMVLPTGTFEITREGRYTAEADMLFHDYAYDVTGALTISESSDVISVTISGNAYKDREPKRFSMTFQGDFVDVVEMK